MHIVIFSAESVQTGYGSATALRTFIEAALAQSNWSMTLVTPTPPDHKLHSSRLRWAVVGNGPSTNRRMELGIFTIRALLRAMTVAQTRPDVVVSWQPIPAGIAGWAATMLCRCRHVVRTCGPELAQAWSRSPWLTLALGPVTSTILQRADAVVVKSELERDLVRPLMLDGRLLLIPNAVGSEFFVSHPSSDHSGVRLLTVCQLEEYKGVARLVSAVDGVARRSSEQIRLTVAGDGSLRDQLERAAARSAAETTFVGRVSRSDLPELYATHDALVVPSLLEGCSNTVLEAMAAGLPVIGHRSALSDLVDDGVNGLLADSSEVLGLQAAIERYLQGSAGPIERVRLASQRRAAAHSVERLIAAYRALFDKLVGQPACSDGRA